MIGLYTGEIAPAAANFRNSNLIPAMQSRNVHEMLKHVRYFFDTTPKKQLRMWTASSGWVPLAEYRSAHMRFSRLLSRLAAQEWLRDASIEIAFFNLEDTFHRDEDGGVMVNLHSHILIRSRRVLGSVAWIELRERVRRFLPKRYLHDGPIESAAECVKYVFKPSELLGVLTGPELAELFRATRKLKFFHPLGPIRQYRRQLDQEGKKLKRVDGAWRIVRRAERECVRENKGEPERDVVVAVTLPMPKFSSALEPCLLVRRFSGDVARLMSRPVPPVIPGAMSVEALMILAQAMATKNAGKARASLKHTTTTTVRADQFVGRPITRGHHMPERDGPLTAT